MKLMISEIASQWSVAVMRYLRSLAESDPFSRNRVPGLPLSSFLVPHRCSNHSKPDIGICQDPPPPPGTHHSHSPGKLLSQPQNCGPES